MREKITYIAFDGKEFDTEMKCREHEENHKSIIEVRRVVDTIKNYCRKNYCGDCPFFDSLQSCKFTENTPEYWEV